MGAYCSILDQWEVHLLKMHCALNRPTARQWLKTVQSCLCVISAVLYGISYHTDLVPVSMLDQRINISC